MSTELKCAMQAAIEKTEARKYGQWSIAHVEEKAANLKGIGYSFSGDALRMVRREQQEAVIRLMELSDELGDTV